MILFLVPLPYGQESPGWISLFLVVKIFPRISLMETTKSVTLSGVHKTGSKKVLFMDLPEDCMSLSLRSRACWVKLMFLEAQKPRSSARFFQSLSWGDVSVRDHFLHHKDSSGARVAGWQDDTWGRDLDIMEVSTTGSQETVNLSPCWF